MITKRLFSLVLLPVCYLLFLATPLQAETQVKSDPVEAKLVAEEQAVQPGRPFYVGVELKMAEGWDTYWRNPGDVGFPTQVQWKLPDGFTAGPLEWPYPEKFVSESLVAFGYTHSVLLLTEITPPKDLKADGPINLSADVSWLACKDSCVPGSAMVSLSLPVAQDVPQKDPAHASLFAKARAQLPKQEGAVTLSKQAEDLLLQFKSGAKGGEVSEVVFIPDQGSGIDLTAPQSLNKESGGFQLSLKAAPGETPTHLKGILLVTEKGTEIKRAITVDTEVGAKTITAPVSEVSSIYIALVFAFFGGLILNVMPCVLPVIALKIFSFVKLAHEKRSLILKHGGVFALGVLVSFWVLSGALLILRAYGEGVGWGFQLQEPVFVVVLALILFLLGLSLFGVFEMGTSLISLGQKGPSSSSSPLKSSFMSGVLATLVATPCTGPLLGPALGFAMTLPPLSALAIFSCMGLGMASPYLLFSAFPKLVRFLPKPGNWMIVFKQLMGFFMMATVVWLIWVFGAQTSQIALFVLLASLLVIALGAWIFGKWAVPSKSKATRMVATVMAALILFTGGGATIMSAKQSQQEERNGMLVGDVNGSWRPFSADEVQKLRQAGTPVFVDFTAKWCLICQANKVVLHSSDVTKAFQEHGVVTMMADWTKRDTFITDELKRLGRSGVPVYVLYPADPEQTPYILPQTLTSSVVSDYLGKLTSGSATVHAD